MKSIQEWKRKAKRIRDDLYILPFALKDHRVPWYAKALAVLTIAYALSPVDLIPDFIPIIGYLDDLILLPLALYLTIKMIPKEVRIEYRNRAKSETISSRVKWNVAGTIILFWIALLCLIVRIIWL